MKTTVRILILALFALSLWWGMAQDVIMPGAFTDEHYPYWWGRAEIGLPETWGRLEQMGVWDEYR